MTQRQKKLLMIVNPRAGKSKSRGPLFDAAVVLCRAGYLLSVRETAAAGDAVEIAAREGGKYDAVVAVGGDGTLNEAICGLMRLKDPPPLGYLPQGSTNDFAASLHISGRPPEAAEAIVRSASRKLDIGRWNDRYFVYVASFGAFTRTSYTATQDAKNAFGHFAYLLEGMKDLSSLRPYRIRLTADGEALDGEYLFGAVCNSTSIGGFLKLSSEDVVLDDGKFELLLVPSPQNAGELQETLMALMSQDYRSRGLVFRHASSLHLETEDELPWSLDGEYAPNLPSIQIENCARSIEMLL